MKDPTYGDIPIDFSGDLEDLDGEKSPRYYWINPTAYICDRCRVFHNSTEPCPLGVPSGKTPDETKKALEGFFTALAGEDDE